MAKSFPGSKSLVPRWHGNFAYFLMRKLGKPKLNLTFGTWSPVFGSCYAPVGNLQFFKDHTSINWPVYFDIKIVFQFNQVMGVHDTLHEMWQLFLARGPPAPITAKHSNSFMTQFVTNFHSNQFTFVEWQPKNLGITARPTAWASNKSSKM